MKHVLKILLASALASVACNLLAAETPASLLGEFHLKQGQDYSAAKAILLKHGWTVDMQYGNGTNPYGFSEVICGNGWDAVCSARFLLASRKVLITLKPKKTLVVEGIWDDK